MRIDGYPLIRVFKCFCFLDCTRTGLVLKKKESQAPVGDLRFIMLVLYFIILSVIQQMGIEGVLTPQCHSKTIHRNYFCDLFFQHT